MEEKDSIHEPSNLHLESPFTLRMLYAYSTCISLLYKHPWLFQTARHSIISRPSQRRKPPIGPNQKPRNHVRASHQVSSTARRLRRIGPQTNRQKDNTKQNSTSFRQRWRRRLDFCVLATYLGYCYGIGWDGLGVCSCHARGGSGTYVMRMTRRYRNEPIQLVLLKPAAIWWWLLQVFCCIFVSLIFRW